MDKKELITSIKDGLQIDFNAVSTGSGTVSLNREYENCVEQIIFSYNKFPGEYILGASVAGWKRINSVENILGKHFVKNKINQPLVTIHLESKRIEKLSDIPIRNKEDVTKILPLLETMIFEEIFPFFDNYNSIEDIYSKVKELEESMLSTFIFNPPLPRMMIIKRLAKATDWKEYCEKVINIYKEQSEGKYKAVFAPIYSFLPSLFDELKSM